jgi:hypothetical protein
VQQGNNGKQQGITTTKKHNKNNNVKTKNKKQQKTLIRTKMHSEHDPFMYFLQEGTVVMRRFQPNSKFSLQLNPKTWT